MKRGPKLDAQQWAADLDSANLMLSGIRATIDKRDRLVRNGEDPGNLTTRIRKELNTLNDALSSLDRDLSQMGSNAARYRITQVEVRRRRETLVNMQRETTRLIQEQQPPPPMEQGSAAQSGSTGSRTQTQTHMSGPQSQMTRELLLKQERALQEQDKVLDQIDSDLDRVKEHAINIGQEADLHNSLLDNLDENVDEGIGAIQTETERARLVAKTSETCGLWCCIVILSLILLFLIGFKLS